jgi:hypothetical protein
MAGEAGRRWPRAVAVAGVLVLVAGVGWAVVAWVRGGAVAAPESVLGRSSSTKPRSVRGLPSLGFGAPAAEVGEAVL